MNSIFEFDSAVGLKLHPADQKEALKGNTSNSLLQQKEDCTWAF